MRLHALTNKHPTVILASVALAWLMVYGNRKSAKDPRNPNSLTLLIIIPHWTTKAGKGRRRHKNFQAQEAYHLQILHPLILQS